MWNELVPKFRRGGNVLNSATLAHSLNHKVMGGRRPTLRRLQKTLFSRWVPFLSGYQSQIGRLQRLPFGAHKQQQ